MTFKKLGLDEWLVDALSKVGITTPTEVQSKCIPEILLGKDIIASAQTGKTYLTLYRLWENCRICIADFK
jgi:superfamily II DNA/RNA helicase